MTIGQPADDSSFDWLLADSPGQASFGWRSRNEKSQSSAVTSGTLLADGRFDSAEMGGGEAWDEAVDQASNGDIALIQRRSVDGTTTVSVSHRSPGSAASEPVVLQSVRDEEKAYLREVAISIDSSGREVAAWTVDDYTSKQMVSRIFVSSTTDGKTWSAPQSLGSETGYRLNLYLTNSDSGVVRAVWAVSEDPACHLTSSTFAPGSGQWSTAKQIWSSGSKEDCTIRFSVGSQSDGTTVASWQVERDTKSMTLAAVAKGEGSFGQPTLLASGRDRGVPRYISNGKSSALVWTDFRSRLLVSRLSASGSWGRVETVAEHLLDEDIDAVMDSAGQLHVIWLGDGIPSNVIYVRSTVASGGWTKAKVAAADVETPRNIYIGADSAGRAVVVWEDNSGNNVTISGAQRVKTGRWSSKRVLSSSRIDGDQARIYEVAQGASGPMYVAWSHDAPNSTPTSLHLAVIPEFNLSQISAPKGSGWITTRRLVRKSKIRVQFRGVKDGAPVMARFHRHGSRDVKVAAEVDGSRAAFDTPRRSGVYRVTVSADGEALVREYDVKVHRSRKPRR